MKRKFRPRITYANVIASLALFVALGGAAVAAGLPKASVGPKQLKHGAVTAAAIRKGAVTAGKIKPKAVTTGKLGPAAVTPGNIGNGAITTEKIAAGSVIASTIKNGVITSNKLTNANVTTEKLADGAVTSAKLGAGSVNSTKLAPELLNSLTNVGTLKTAQTVRGVFDVGGVNPRPDGSVFSARGSITFQQPLANTPSVVVVQKGGPYPAQCPGLGAGESTPAAATGYLCIYLTTTTNLDPNASLATEVPNRLGVGLVATAQAKEGVDFAAIGQWAVTAP